MNDLQDRAALIAEVTDLADTNIAALDRYCDALGVSHRAASDRNVSGYTESVC